VRPPQLAGAVEPRKLLRRGALVALGAAALLSMRRPLGQLAGAAGQLADVRLGWFAAMAAAEVASFACMWALTKLLLPRLSWFVAATSQLASNSVSRVIPGGAAAGGAVLYRRLAVTGIGPAEATGAMLASTIISYIILLAVPAPIAIVTGAPLPDGLGLVFVTGAAACAALTVVSVTLIVFDWPVRAIGRGVAWAAPVAGRLAGRDWTVGADTLSAERRRLLRLLGPRWPMVLAAAAGNWAFDYLALLGALHAVGADPDLSTVLVAFAAASVLGTVPLTPGGAGFVEVGMYSALIVSGVEAGDAAVATVAYRLVSWWLPVVAGAGAWLAFAARYPLAARGRTLSRPPASQGPTRRRPDRPAGAGFLPSLSCNTNHRTTGKVPAT
jgi:uncharacterized membrane protein YbhN (UPF0104 family)